MNYGKINPMDIANGTGVRVSLFVSGCNHHCKGCFNPQTWDFNYGEPFTEKEEALILDLLRPDHIQGFTLLGGEPMEHIKTLTPLLKTIKNKYPQKDIWCYTGYHFEDIKERASEMLKYIDVLVDGPFILEEKDISLPFRGSRNQRILKVQEML